MAPLYWYKIFSVCYVLTFHFLLCYFSFINESHFPTPSPTPFPAYTYMHALFTIYTLFILHLTCPPPLLLLFPVFTLWSIHKPFKTTKIFKKLIKLIKKIGGYVIVYIYSSCFLLLCSLRTLMYTHPQIIYMHIRSNTLTNISC